MIVTEEHVDKIFVAGRNHATTSLLVATSWSLRSTSIARSIKLLCSPNSVPQMSPSSTSSRRTMTSSSSVFEGEPMDDSVDARRMSSRPAGPAPDNRRFVIVAGDALAIMTFSGDSVVKLLQGDRDLITGLAEVFDQPLYLLSGPAGCQNFSLALTIDTSNHSPPLSTPLWNRPGLASTWKQPAHSVASTLRGAPHSRYPPRHLRTPTIVEMRLEGCDYFGQPDCPVYVTSSPPSTRTLAANAASSPIGQHFCP